MRNNQSEPICVGVCLTHNIFLTDIHLHFLTLSLQELFLFSNAIFLAVPARKIATSNHLEIDSSSHHRILRWLFAYYLGPRPCHVNVYCSATALQYWIGSLRPQTVKNMSKSSQWHTATPLPHLHYQPISYIDIMLYLSSKLNWAQCTGNNLQNCVCVCL